MPDNRTHPGSEEELARIEAAERPELQRNKILALAKELFPEDGYDTEDENTASSLFILLCQATILYAAGPPYSVPVQAEDVEIGHTLSAVAENMWTEDLRFMVEIVKVDHADEMRRAIERFDLDGARRHLEALERQRDSQRSGSLTKAYASVREVQHELRPAGNL